MPIHDWTRVTAGTFHDFHLAWLTEIRNALNGGILPSNYYAQAEQIAGPMGPDVLTRQIPEETENGGDHGIGADGGVAMAPPSVRWTAKSDMSRYVTKRRTLVIRHSIVDRIVAFIEIVSSGNKSSTSAFRTIVEKAADALQRGYHLLIVDLFPPTRHDPLGVHAAIWREIGEDWFEQPENEPLVLAAYSAGSCKEAFVEPTRIGRDLPDMPLFLDPDRYVNVPLESTYMAAYRGVPRKWKGVLESTPD